MKKVAQQEVCLLDLLKEMAPDSSVSSLRSWIEKGRVQVAGQLVDRAKHKVLAGQEVQVGPRVVFLRGNIKILYQDPVLVAIDKPEGLLSVATDFQKDQTAHAILKRNLRADTIFPVHRLDRETSGVLLFALTAECRTYFKAEFANRTIDKTYYAVVQGSLPEEQGSWESYLKEDAHYFVRSTEDPSEGKFAKTDFVVVKKNSRYTLLKLKLETGRKNQIRVHCQDAGFPIVGDTKYGSTCNRLGRMCLHAGSIRFQHPQSGRLITLESPVPLEFLSLFP